MTLQSHVAEGQIPRSTTRRLAAAARVLMGLIFLVMGLNGFLNFLPQPATFPERTLAFVTGLARSGYMIPLLFGTQVVAAVLLLSNRFVPLALAVLAPVVVNIIAFHLFLAPSGLPMAAVVLALEIYLAWTFREAYRPLLGARAVPASK